MPVALTTSLALTELLRLRQALPLEQAHPLLGHLPPLLDACPPESFRIPLLHQLYVVFVPALTGSVEATAVQPVEQWPPFLVQFGPSDDAGNLGAELTLPPQFSRAAPAVAHLAALWYEVLGGRIRGHELLAGRFAALASLSERGNDLLRVALSPQSPASCTAFYQEWTAQLSLPALPPPVSLPVRPVTRVLRTGPPPLPSHAVPSTFHIPNALLSVAEPHEVLELTPAAPGGVPTRLVARHRFHIGRSRRQSDLPTLAVSPEQEQHAGAVAELSRIHATLELNGTSIRVRDGNGQKPSSNGSTWQGRPLSPLDPTPVTQDGRLLLSPDGARYSITVQPQPRLPLAEFELANRSDWAGPSAAEPPACSFSAVLFRHPSSYTVTREAVWLLTAVSFRVTAASEFEWAPEGLAPYAFVHRFGCFWLLKLSREGDTTVNTVPLQAGQAAPLADGLVLTLSGVSFVVGAV